ncbi:MAG TPA: hypothetical protein VGD60_06755 [Candidatus Acidoferrales bacterium]
MFHLEICPLRCIGCTNATGGSSATGVDNNAQFAIQPFYVPGNVAPFVAPAGTLTSSLRWESGKATFRTVRGSSARPGAAVVSEHVFTSGVPTPGTELIQFLFYVVASDQHPMQHESEVVIEKFEYLP